MFGGDSDPGSCYCLIGTTWGEDVAVCGRSPDGRRRNGPLLSERDPRMWFPVRPLHHVDVYVNLNVASSNGRRTRDLPCSIEGFGVDTGERFLSTVSTVSPRGAGQQLEVPVVCVVPKTPLCIVVDHHLFYEFPLGGGGAPWAATRLTCCKLFMLLSHFSIKTSRNLTRNLTLNPFIAPSSGCLLHG